MCNMFKDHDLYMFKDHDLVAKFDRSIESQPRDTPGNIYALPSERSVDYNWDSRVFTVLYMESMSRRGSHCNFLFSYHNMLKVFQEHV